MGGVAPVHDCRRQAAWLLVDSAGIVVDSAERRARLIRRLDFRLENCLAPLPASGPGQSRGRDQSRVRATRPAGGDPARLSWLGGWPKARRKRSEERRVGEEG